MDAIAELREKMQRFVNGGDRSLALAGEIEVDIDELMADKEPFASLTLALASFRPEGGQFLYTETDIIPLMLQALAALDVENASNG